MEAKLVGISIAINEGESTYIPLGHDYPNAPSQLDITRALEKLKPILGRQKNKKSVTISNMMPIYFQGMAFN